MKIRWLFGSLLTLGLLAISIAALDSDSKVSEGWRRFTSDPGQACFDFEKGNFKDPYSARFDGYWVDPVDRGTVTIKYHAKNGYGAYGAGESVCYVQDGIVNKDLTDLKRGNKELEARLDKLRISTKCLERKNRLMNSGFSATAAEKELSDSCSF